MRAFRLRNGMAMVAVLAALLLQVTLPGGGAAGGGGSPGAPIASAQGQDGSAKIETRLRVLSEQARGGQLPSFDDARSVGVAAVGSHLRVIVESTGGVRPAARVASRQFGGYVEAEYADLVQVLIPADRLLTLAADPRVRYIRAPYAVGPRAIAGQGVQASGASTWHAANVNGAGVTVAVIDGGFMGLADRKAQGDIPAGAQLVDLCNGNVNATEHGTGVAEIVHEMAPAAQLILYCVGSEVQLGQAKDQAKAAGAHIISMSLAYFNTSRGDGSGGPATPDGIVADARQSGILWVNSAGNANAGENWNGAWNDPNNDGFLDWVNGDATNTQEVQNGQNVCGNLKWDAWPTTAQDFALEIRDPANFATHLTPPADNLQSGTQAPVETTCYTNNTGAARNIDWVVRRVNATAPFPPHFELSVFNQRLEHFKTTMTIDTPASSPSALAVGAICWQSERLEDYSSRGPTIDGRIKPDIAGQSVVSSGAYGPWTSCPANADGTGGFNGTSAAAPHVAGAAALVKQANTGFNPAQLQAFLEGRARDVGTAGKDNLYGSGILTLGAVATTPAPVPGARSVILTVTRVAQNRLRVQVAAAAGHTLQSLAWTLPANATVESASGAPLPTGLTLPAGATSTEFYMVKTSGSAATLSFEVRGSFGLWKTFVGGGPNAW